MTTKCTIVAEAGLNHNGDVNRAHRMIDAAAAAGVDAVKFQCYRTGDFLADRSLLYEGINQYEMFERCELPDWAWIELQAHCNEKGVLFFATPTSEQRLAFLLELGVPMLKNGSDYLGHLPLIRAMARSGLKTIISVGMGTVEEIDEAVTAFDVTEGAGELVLMQCTSVYPCPPEEVNLRRLETLARWYGCPVGFSDHTDGLTAAPGAVALGASIVEKHFTLDRKSDGPDHHFSADPAELQILVNRIRQLEAMLGEPRIYPTASEERSRREFRVTERDGVYLRRGG